MTGANAFRKRTEKTIKINTNDTGVVFIDPQNEVLSDKGLAWRSVGNSVKENKTVQNNDE